MPTRPCGYEARQVLPVPFVPGGAGAHLEPASTHAASVPAAQHSAEVAHRHRPSSHFLLAQSAFFSQIVPAKWVSTPLAGSSSSAHDAGVKLPFEPTTRSARKSPSVSATTGFSCHVLDDRY